MSAPVSKVRLVEPAKVGTRWLPAGEHEVTPEEEIALLDAGLLEGGSVPSTVAGDQDHDPATVIAEMEATIAMQALQIADLTDRLAIASGTAGQAGADLAPPQSGAAPADKNTPPSEKAAKTAPKKGAAATKG